MQVIRAVAVTGALGFAIWFAVFYGPFIVAFIVEKRFLN